MSNAILLLQSQANNKNLNIDDEGRLTFNFHSLAAITGVTHQLLSRSFDPSNIKRNKLAQFLVEQGVDPSNMLLWKTNGIPDTAVAYIVQYYASFAGQHCTKEARLMAVSLIGVGLRTFGQKVLGYASGDTSRPRVLQSPMATKLASLEESKTAIASEITIQEKVIEELRRQYDDVELEIADIYIELYEPIRVKLEYYEEKRIDAMGKKLYPSKNSNNQEQ